MLAEREGFSTPAEVCEFIAQNVDTNVRDLEGALVHRAVEERWGLKELRPAQLSLEEVFLKLTRDESEHL